MTLQRKARTRTRNESPAHPVEIDPKEVPAIFALGGFKHHSLVANVQVQESPCAGAMFEG